MLCPSCRQPTSCTYKIDDTWICITCYMEQSHDMWRKIGKLTEDRTRYKEALETIVGYSKALKGAFPVYPLVILRRTMEVARKALDPSLSEEEEC